MSTVDIEMYRCDNIKGDNPKLVSELICSSLERVYLKFIITGTFDNDEHDIYENINLNFGNLDTMVLRYTKGELVQPITVFQFVHTTSRVCYMFAPYYWSNTWFKDDNPISLGPLDINGGAQSNSDTKGFSEASNLVHYDNGQVFGVCNVSFGSSVFLSSLLTVEVSLKVNYRSADGYQHNTNISKTFSMPLTVIPIKQLPNDVNVDDNSIEPYYPNYPNYPDYPDYPDYPGGNNTQQGTSAEGLQVNSSKVSIKFKAPSPVRNDEAPPQWNLQFKANFYKDEACTQLITSVDTINNIGAFKLKTEKWPSEGISPDLYGTDVIVTADVGPRKEFWMRIDAGANDA